MTVMKFTLLTLIFAATNKKTAGQRAGGKREQRRRHIQQQQRALVDTDVSWNDESSSMSTSMAFTTDPVASVSGGSSSKSGKAVKETTTIYFVRHGEQTTTTTSLGQATLAYNVEWVGDDATVTPRDLAEQSVGENIDQVCGVDKCAEELGDQGLTRANLLANWMSGKGILAKVTDVFASHKRRTAQTVSPVATMAGLDVVQFPVNQTELDPEGNSASICPTVAALQASTLGSTIVVAAHTSTIYQIMDGGNGDECAGLGLDTSDPKYFPKDERGRLPRDQYGNVWKISIDQDGTAHLEERAILELAFAETAVH